MALANHNAAVAQNCQIIVWQYYYAIAILGGTVSLFQYIMSQNHLVLFSDRNVFIFAGLKKKS